MVGKAQHLTSEIGGYTNTETNTKKAESPLPICHVDCFIQKDREKNWLDRKHPLYTHTDREIGKQAEGRIVTPFRRPR
jgi:hypothetical protein